MLPCVTNKSMVYKRILSIGETIVTSAQFNDYAFYVYAFANVDVKKHDHVCEY